MDVSIAIDAMGGDHGPQVTVPAAVGLLARHPALSLHLVGDERAIEAALQGCTAVPAGRVTVHHASQVVAMDERPSLALRGKRDSSMRVAINLVRDGTVAACVSAGNTGALMATARFVLKTLPGVDRPAICAAMPGVRGSTHVLDLGANVDCSSEELFQFAVMGSILTSAVLDKEAPTVALLNVGEEEIKGNDRVKQTAALLAESSLNYVGFCEGDDLFLGEVDVIVCDGFVGNVALKASEGVARMIGAFLREEFGRDWRSRLAALMGAAALRRLRRRVDPREYNGASLLGLRGIVVKSHGSADRLGFARAVEQALIEVEKAVPERIADLVERTLAERQAS